MPICGSLLPAATHLRRLSAGVSIDGDRRIDAGGDCSDLAGADGKPLPSTAQVARQQALFLAKSLASHIKSGAPFGHFKYRDMGSLSLWENMPLTVRWCPMGF